MCGIHQLGARVRSVLNGALDALARTHAEAAREVARQDHLVIRDYEGVLRPPITFMMEDPRTIRRVMGAIWAARTLERIGDHAKNICEYIIYMVKGQDVSHIRIDETEGVAKGRS